MKHIARALSNLGRNGDSELVHMTKGEVAVLDHVARSHGLGSLPVNPHTGLREANILDSLQHAPDTFREFQHATTTGSPWGWGQKAIYYTDPTSRALQGTGHQGSANAYSNTAAAIGMLYSAGAAMGLTGTSGSAGTAGTAGTEAAMYTSPTAGAEAAGSGAATTGAVNTGTAGTAGMSGASGISGSGTTSASGFGPASSGSLAGGLGSGSSTGASGLGTAGSSSGILGSGSVNAGDASMMGVGSGGESAGPGTASKALSWMGSHPYETVWAANAVGQMLNKPKKQEPHQVELKGQSTTSSNPGDSPYNYTSAPSTYVMRYAQGGPIRGFADGGQAAPAPTAAQYASLGIAQPQAAPQAPAAPQGGIASLPQAQAQPQQQWQDPTMSFNQSWNPPAGQQQPAANAIPPELMGAIAPAPSDPNTTTSGWMDQAIANSPSVQAQKQKDAEAAAAQAAAAAQKQQQKQQSSQAYLNAHAGGGGNADQRDNYNRVYQQVHGTPPPRTTAGNADQRERQRQQGIAAPRAAGNADQRNRHAKGGILNLHPHGKHLPPAFLTGPGDGMSDDIQANIQGARGRPGEPVRVADGEFIVPADVVAHLGNGSSNAGAKKLEQMGAKVRKARTGKTKQAPAIKPEKYL